MTIPAKFRDLLLAVCEGQVVITIDPNTKNLALYPVEIWEEIQVKIESLPSLNPQARRLQHLFIGHASDVEMDSSGRVLLPSILRDIAVLEKKLILVGLGKKIEIWSKELWEQRYKDIQDMKEGLDELPPEMQSLSL